MLPKPYFFDFLMGAKTVDPWGRHIGDIQYGHHPGKGYKTQKSYNNE